MNRLQQVWRLGQSIWIDYIERSFIDSGELSQWIAAGVRGLTSNPAIFQQAIATSAVYDRDIRLLAERSLSPLAIYEQLAIQDIRAAADLFLPLYETSGRLDGYVSLEVPPALANDTDGTVAEAVRLFDSVDRPNLMIKIPATAAGIAAVTRVLAAGINVNVTLIFGLQHYREAVAAFMSGMQQLADAGGNLQKVSSVASFFVSRLDTVVDPLLQSRGLVHGLGRTAILQASAAYDLYGQLFSTSQWQRLAAAGARKQRLLWASTSTKNPAYADTLYVDRLIGAHTINTVPPTTLKAFQDHGRAERALPADRRQTAAELKALTQAGIDLEQITEQLQQAGLAAFADSFDKLLSKVAEKAHIFQR